MLAIVVVILAVILVHRQVVVYGGLASAGATPAVAPRKVNPQLAQLVVYADRLYAEKKWLAAEKAYLKVLKIDHKNITAYSHLGIIYSAQHNFADAIECFEIAARMRPGAVTLQNLAVAYYENHNYIKAINAFEKAIVFEPSATRYIGLSKSYKKVANQPHMLTALEKAAELDDSKRVGLMLADAYEDAGRRVDAAAVYRRLLDAAPGDPELRRLLHNLGQHQAV